MESRLLQAIDAAVELALPAGWPRVPRSRLPVRGGVCVRHAFRRQAGTGAASYLAVAAVPSFGAKPRDLRRDLTALVDLVLSRGASLLLLYQGAEEPARWIQDHLDCPHPRFLCLPCAWAGDDCTVQPTACGAEPLAHTLCDLWRGALFYAGPDEGLQTVGVEIMRDRCWRCHVKLATLTGLVFPDRQVGSWAAPDWAYFGQPLELAAIPDSLIPPLSAAVDGWRAAGEHALTVIRWRHSRTVRRSYWAAECPKCGAFRGAFPVVDHRSTLLSDIRSRLAGDLSYRPLPLDVPREALRALGWGVELTPHACPLEWHRAGTPEPAGPQCQSSQPGLGPIAMSQLVAESGIPNLYAGGLASGMNAAAELGGARHLRRLGQILLTWRGRRS